MSYSGNPEDSDRDLVRFRTGDVYGPKTNSPDTFQPGEVVNDNEIDLLLSLYSVNRATKEIFKILLPRLAAKVDEKVDDVEIDYSSWYTNLKDSMNTILKDLTVLDGPYVGGVFTAQVAQVTTSDVVKPLFTMDD